VKENRLRLAAGPSPPPAWAAGADHSFRSSQNRASSDLASEMESFTNCIKCSLSRIGIDQHRLAEFFKQARGILDAMENQRSGGHGDSGPRGR
jgi:hypothetical protein